MQVGRVQQEVSCGHAQRVSACLWRILSTADWQSREQLAYPD